MPDEHQSDFWKDITEVDATALLRIYGTKDAVEEAYLGYLDSTPEPTASVRNFRTPATFAAIRLAYEFI